MLVSIVLILFLGIIFGKLFEKIKLPALLGFIVCGVLIGPYALNLLDSVIVGNEYMPGIAGEIRNLALIIILLRAGLGIQKSVLKQIGAIAAKMSVIPCIIEGTLITIAGVVLLGLPVVESGMLGFIIAAVSPAVIVPSMLNLQEKGYGENRNIPTLILGAASIDDVIAITIFSAFLNMGVSGESIGVLSAILSIVFQIAGGVLAGFIVAKIINYIFSLNKLNELEILAVTLIGAISLFAVERVIEIAGLLGVMTLGFMIAEERKEESLILKTRLGDIWYFAQIFLFVLVGAEVNTELAIQGGLIGAVIVAIGLSGRALGVFISTYGTELNTKEKLFCVIAYSPKATVQAAIGAVPLAMGVPSGELILVIAVLAILITVPIGAIGIEKSAPKLLEARE